MTRPYRTEFPDFAPETMPAIPAGFIDDSWHNDACPSFFHPGLRLRIFIDYAEAAERELEGPRFCLGRDDDPEGTIAVLMTDDWSEIERFISGAAPEGRSGDGCAQVVAEGVQSPEA